jgi:U3 small nucleolar RNA-associated protein 3
MGKRRNTAKTGDKKLYKSRFEELPSKGDDKDDPMYGKVDKFHNKRDEEFLKLGDAEESDSDGEDKVEAVMDLGAGGESSNEEEESSSEEEESEGEARGAVDDSSSDDDDDEEEEIEDPRDWGTKKSAYYHADTTDLEIGQDEEDAYDEEKAAKEVRSAMLEDMTEEDFALEEDGDDQQQPEEKDEVVVSRDVMKLSKKEKQKLLDKLHPEMLPLLSFFAGTVKDLHENTSVATGALFDGEGNAEVCNNYVLL